MTGDYYIPRGDPRDQGSSRPPYIVRGDGRSGCVFPGCGILLIFVGSFIAWLINGAPSSDAVVPRGVWTGELHCSMKGEDATLRLTFGDNSSRSLLTARMELLPVAGGRQFDPTSNDMQGTAGASSFTLAPRFGSKTVLDGRMGLAGTFSSDGSTIIANLTNAKLPCGQVVMHGQ
jgi:hypothetical protein